MRDTATRVILPYFQNLEARMVERKADTPDGSADIVTIADKLAEEKLSEGLARILPEATIIGEEACEADPTLLERLGDDLTWIIDPLDGTNNFGAGRTPFGIMIALTERGATIAGWIFDPVTGRFCHAARGQGAWLNGERVFARESGAARPIAAISMLFADPERRRELQQRISGQFELADAPRCAAEQYPRLVLGTNDIALFERVLAWDHAPGALFVNEAGGKVARLDGRAYRVDQRERGLLGAASPRLWDYAAQRLNA